MLQRIFSSTLVVGTSWSESYDEQKKTLSTSYFCPHRFAVRSPGMITRTMLPNRKVGTPYIVRLEKVSQIRTLVGLTCRLFAPSTQLW